jgi:ABC-type branched-subunit amino acid transport system ATPase component/ABC-type branched-subunit amino acid transport system permease subunit
VSGWAYYVVVLLVYLFTDLLAAWGLNLEFGVAGVANFAFIVLVALGAYVYSVLTLGPSSANGGYQAYIIGLHLPAAAAIIIAALVTAAFGCLIGLTGLRRLRQDYQAMTMLVISIMAVTVVSADTRLFNGNAGLSAIPNPLASLGSPRDQWGYAILTGIICLAAYPVLRRFTAGPMGRTLRAVRDDEDAAAATGKNVFALRLLVQGVGGALAGLSGALLAGFIGGWSPSAWQYVETLALLSAIIVGGLGDDFGVMAGTIVIPVLVLQGVQFLPQFKSNPQLIDDGGWILLGTLTIAFIWLRPQGMIPERRPRGLGTHAKQATPGPTPAHDDPEPAVVVHPISLAERSSASGGSGGSPPRASRVERAVVQVPQSVRGNGFENLAAYTRSGPGEPAPGADLLEVADLHRHYGGVRAVDGASLRVKAGSITGLIGPNGAGKSTLLDLVSGFGRPDSGTVRFDGRDITGRPAYRRARAGIVRTFQLPHEFRRLTTIENLLAAPGGQRAESAPGILAGRRYWRSQEAENLERARALLAMFGMAEKADQLAGRLSGGQKRMLEVMRALMTAPRLLLLDEPLAGLSPVLSERLEEICLELRALGLSMILVEHELGAVGRLCDHVIVMAQGKVLSEGTMAELRVRKEVQQAYVVG